MATPEGEDYSLGTCVTREAIVNAYCVIARG